MQVELSQKDNRLKELGSFLLKLLLIWLSWKLFSWVIGEERTPISERYFPAFSARWESLCDGLRKILLIVCDSFLHWLGYKTQLLNYYILRVEGFGGIALGDYCLGFQLMYFFSMLIIISNLPALKKMAGVISGILLIQLLNILRITGLILVDVHAHNMMYLSHDYLFSIPVAGFLLSYYWRMTKKERLS